MKVSYYAGAGTTVDLLFCLMEPLWEQIFGDVTEKIEFFTNIFSRASSDLHPDFTKYCIQALVKHPFVDFKTRTRYSIRRSLGPDVCF